MDNQKLLRGVMIVSGIAAIAYMILSVMKKIFIPGFLPIAFVVLLAALYRLEVLAQNKKKNKTILIIIMVLELISAVLQIKAALGV